MPVKIFFPRVPDNEEEFYNFFGQICPAMVNSIRIIKNPDGRSFCILPVHYCDTNGKSALDIIEVTSGKKVGDVILKPRIYIDSCLLKQLDSKLVQQETEDDFVNVTHYYQDYYYIQLKSESQRNQTVRDYLRNLYEELQSNMLTTLDLEELNEGQLYATLFMNDNSLYRVKVIERCSSDEIKVLFIDYGNIEIIENQPVVAISEELASLPPLAHKCSMVNVRIIDEKKHDLFSREVINRNFKAKLIKTTNDEGLQCVTAVDFLNFCMVSYRSFLIIESIAVEYISEQEDALNYKIESVANGFTDVMGLVVMTHISSLEEFYVQQANKDIDENLALIVTLTDHLTSRLRENLEFTDENVLYLTKFTGDGNWYRSKVTEDRWNEPDDAYCVVQFIDFGNSEKKYNVKDLKPLTKEWCDQAVELSTIAACAHKCSFNKTLIKGLKEAKVNETYFQENMILTEKIMELYYFDNGKVWTVNNIIIKNEEEENEVDLAKKYDNKPDVAQSSSPDLYRLSNLESIHKIWFQLIWTKDPEKLKQIQIIKKWSSGSVPSETKTLTSVTLNSLYCAVNKHGHLYRCRVTARNIDRAVVQLIDSGIQEVIKLTSLFPLRSSIASVPPLSRPYQLSLKVLRDQEEEAEIEIIKILKHSEVELKLLSKNVIKDVVVKGTSLIESLVQYTLLNKQDKYKDLPECLQPPVTEEGDVDFTLPSVDNMDEVPSDIAVENGRVRILRKLFKNEDDECIFESIWDVMSECEKLNEVVQCCGEVDHVVSEMEGVKSDLCEMVMVRASKFRDLQPLLEKRTSLCNNICALFDNLQSLLNKTTEDHLRLLLEKVQTLLRGIKNVVDIVHLTASTNTDDVEDVAVLQDQITLFRQSSLYRDTLLPQILERAHVTDVSINKLRGLVEVMIKEYELQEDLPNNSVSVTVPLVDVTYEVHSAMKAETSLIIHEVLSHPEVSITKALINYQLFLQSKKTLLELVMIKSGKLRSIHNDIVTIVKEDDEVLRSIEETHKKILSSRSALRHAVPDLEDAEELDLKERQQELMIKIREIRRSLHVDLRTTLQLTQDSTIRNLMLKKPELQLKNQSIFFNDHGMPIFVWDSIYMDMCHEASLGDSYMDSFFGEDKVKVSKISLSKEHYKTALSNISLFSCTLSSIRQDIDVIPILFIFMSKSGHIAVHVVMPDFSVVSRLPSHITQTLSTIVTFFKDVLNQMVVLWHLGYIFTEDDLKHSLFYEYKDEAGIGRVSLPLPLSSIINRDKLSDSAQSPSKEASISVSMKKVCNLFKETLQQCEDVKMSQKVQESLSGLVDVVNNCGEIEQVEGVIEEFEEFIVRLRKEDDDDDDGEMIQEEEDVACSSSLSGHGSSIEKVKDEMEEVEDKTQEEAEDKTQEEVEDKTQEEVKDKTQEEVKDKTLEEVKDKTLEEVKREL